MSVFLDIWALLFWFAPTYPILVSKTESRTTFWTTFLNNLSLSKVVHKSCSNLNNFSKKLSKKVVQVGTTFSKSCPRKLSNFEQLIQEVVQKMSLKNVYTLVFENNMPYTGANQNKDHLRKLIQKVVQAKKLFNKVVQKSCLKYKKLSNKLFKKVVRNRKSCPTSCSKKLSEINKVVQQVVQESCPKLKKLFKENPFSSWCDQTD